MVQLSRCSGMYYSGYGGVSQEQHLQKYLDALTRVTSIHYAILMNNETRELPALTTGYFPDTMSLCFILYHFILDQARKLPRRPGRGQAPPVPYTMTLIADLWGPPRKYMLRREAFYVTLGSAIRLFVLEEDFNGTR